MLELENPYNTEKFYFYKALKILSQNTSLNFDSYRILFVEKRMQSRMMRVKCTSYESYYNLLLTNSDEFEKFKQNFNINYTYFFRNRDIFEKLQAFVLETYDLLSKRVIKKKSERNTEEIVKSNCSTIRTIDPVKFNRKAALAFLRNLYQEQSQRGRIRKAIIEKTSLYRKIRASVYCKRPIYIWSCACSTGEEPFTLAMILNNLRQFFPNFLKYKYKIFASDIDKNALKHAFHGVYDEFSLCNIPLNYKNKYFSEEDIDSKLKFRIKEEIKNQVKFIEEDITEGHKYRWRKYDIVFFRNILIYLKREYRKYFIDAVEKQLARGGLLFLGSTESLLNTNNNIKLIDKESNIYIKTAF